MKTSPAKTPGGNSVSRRLALWFAIGMAAMFRSSSCLAQVDPFHRSLLQLGYDQALQGAGPQSLYAYYYYNNPEIAGTNIALRLATAPAYVDGELGFKRPFWATGDIGLGLYGGAFGANYYEVRQGKYYRSQSFYGNGGGTALSLYQRLNPGMRLPLNLVLRGGFIYSAFADTSHTADDFELPDNQPMPFTRVGLRLAGKEPRLYPDLMLEASVWFSRQWRLNSGPYGYDGDRAVNTWSDLYWAYAAMAYSWTNIGHRLSFAATAGATGNADRFSAWRLGGVLPLIAEFPLILPGYYYQELSAQRFVHLYASYLLPLDTATRFQLRFEAATALIDYLDGFEQPTRWQTGVGCGLVFTPRNKVMRVVLRYGYGINAVRDGEDEGAHSVGVLFQFDFDQYKQWRRARR